MLTVEPITEPMSVTLKLSFFEDSELEIDEEWFKLLGGSSAGLAAAATFTSASNAANVDPCCVMGCGTDDDLLEPVEKGGNFDAPVVGDITLVLPTRLAGMVSFVVIPLLLLACGIVFVSGAILDPLPRPL